MDNYIVINGKRAELTKEQLVALGIEIEKENPFELKNTDYYYFIGSTGIVIYDYSSDCSLTKLRYNVANFCTNKAFMEQRALHETLNRLLWRYSMQHDGDEINWLDVEQIKYYIYYHAFEEEYRIDVNQLCKSEGTIYFISKKVAEDAIEEVVKPFIKQHPEFEW